jgi:hypothetical protein
MVYEMCRKFADEELSPHAGKWDKEHSFPVEAVNKLVSLKEREREREIKRERERSRERERARERVWFSCM